MKGAIGIKKIKLYQLKNMQKCKFKAFVSQFGFKTTNNKSSAIREVYSTILRDYDYIHLKKDELKSIVLELLEDTYFLTNQEKEIEVATIVSYLYRYIKYERLLTSTLLRKLLTKNTYGKVQIGDYEIEVKVDAIFDNGTHIELVKYKTNATKLSYKARTEKNLPENDIELYLLKKLGEKLFANYNKPIVASFYHLKGKNEDKDVLKQFLEDDTVLQKQVEELRSIIPIDKKEEKALDKQIKIILDVLDFNNTIGNNIITYDYNKDLSNEILELLQEELSFNSEKCTSSDCDFCNYSTLCNYKIESNKLEEVEQVKKANKETRLTPAQQEAINIEDGNYRINAVAGAGKSTVMVLRVIELFKKGYKPSDILMITFTNKGCQELKEKISYWIDTYKIEDINKNHLNIFTFNSFGDSIISNEWQKLRFKEKPKLATRIDVNDIVKELLKEYDKIEWLNYKNPLLNYPNAKGAFKQLLIYFDSIKSFNYDVNSLCEEILVKEKDLLSENIINKSESIFELYNRFNSKLKEKSLIQYQDQVLYTIELFKNYSKLINKYGFKHVIVDEYQDTDFTQVELLKLLEQYNHFKSLVVVGDSSQAIYGFRNTTPKNIINFNKDFNNVKDVFLLDNFRSTKEICNVANQLDKLNTERIDKDIVGRKDGETPKLIKFDTLDDEYNEIVNIIKDNIKNNVPLHEICFIGRTKKELLELKTYLDNAQIPNIVEASELYLDNSNVQHIINLANFFKNTEYNYYIYEYLNIVEDDFKALQTEEIKTAINNFKEALIENFLEMEDDVLKLAYFNSLVNPIVEKDEIAKAFMESLNELQFDTFDDFINHLNKLKLYQDDTSIERDDKKYKAVVLTTAHSSKGKEWDVVINSLNKYDYNEELSALEEERRLLFVSITRAKNKLYITYNTNQDKARGKGNYCLFADELQGVERI